MDQLKEQILENLPQNIDALSIECFRIFHGRGKKIPKWSHLSIDYFQPTILLTIYEETSAETLQQVIDILKTLSMIKIENILLQKRFQKGEVISVLKGEIPAENYAVENGKKYILNLHRPQNIGFFLDMKKGRDWVAANSQDKNVLNLFAYTCSLSVAALHGGARVVYNVDMSKSSLSIGEKNHLINGFSSGAKFIPYDILNSFGNLKRRGPFDLIIIDPPTNQGESFKVNRDYVKIIKKLNEMTNDNATVMACLNSPFLDSHFLKALFLEHAPSFEFQFNIASAWENQEQNPEEGLKILIFKKL